MQRVKTERELRLEAVVKELLKLRRWKKDLEKLGIVSQGEHWRCKNSKEHYEKQKAALWKEAEEASKG